MMHVDQRSFRCARCPWTPDQSLTQPQAYDAVLAHIQSHYAEGVSRSGGEQEKNEDGGTSLTEDAAVSVSASDQRPHDMGDDKRAAIYRSLAASYAMVTPPLTAAQIHHLALFGAATVRSLLWELGVLQDMHSRDASQPDEQNARIYPCRECGVLRSKAEGGTTFTVCDECWDKHAATLAAAITTLTQVGPEVSNDTSA